ncbi:ATP-binding cassette domain-containing protein [Glycomyces sp. A-F 0318]|uniref:ABC transporter ATP-binding protein n=1 Tax=Glycomyces amatae TaxID=2881355 RepID=UPI001E493479|nr:ATP-binding cassette domain-containing protein [Glycomyces amatae]MCD0445729.1 ATP-binding cassette domain-containing protein [Glycomyces amatae]
MRGAQDTRAAVDIVDLTAGYERGKPVFQGFSASFPDRGTTQVRGRNGSGKSTLAELCSGYLRPWSGTVTVAGREAGDPAARRRRRVCRTEPALYPNLTARDHLSFASRGIGADPAAAHGRARAYGLGDWMSTEAKALSTGNRRKLWLVMCTLGAFDVAILDEPFNGLDDEGRDRLAAEMRDWSERAAVLLIAHAAPAEASVDRTFDLGGPDQPRPEES